MRCGPGAGRGGVVTRRVIIEADGGSRGNPGPAGYGAVVRDADTGELLAEVAAGLGTATNNVAEYSGLIAGLGAALKEGADSAEARMDSKLVVEQMSGRWQVKQPHLRPLVSEAAGLARQLGDVTYTWVPRARNAHADRLANEAMDAQAGVIRTSVTPKSGTQTAPPSHWTGATSSPTRLLMLRHGQTAQPVADALDVPLSVHEGLVETDFGAWEGLTFAEARERDPQLHVRWITDTSVAPPGGESMDAVHRRVRRVRDQLITEHAAATLVVVTHVTPVKALLRMALDAGPALLHRLHLDLASLSIAEFSPDC